jgi:glycosyltransferase involved in cell wall biosynthesis
MPKEYSESAALALPSRNEGMPRTVLEALACETPAVTSALPQLEPVLSEGGIMVPEPDATGLTRALSQLLDDDVQRHRMGKRGRERVTEHHSWETAVTETINEYYRLLDQRDHKAGDSQQSAAIEGVQAHD